MTRLEQNQVAQAMWQMGGSFVRHLGSALQHADPNNAEKIKQAFPEYWEKYLRFSKMEEK